MFDCRCVHKDAKVVLGSLIDDEILRIRTEIERKEKIIRNQLEEGKKRSELLEHSYVVVASEEISQLRDLKNDIGNIPDCF